MAIKNTVCIFIDGYNYTGNLVLPVKIGNFLDERLDEATVSLRRSRTRHFAPLTPVELVYYQTEYYGKPNTNSYTAVRKKTSVQQFIVADDNATEVIPGSGYYNHELYLIELTKSAERVVVDTITYTNVLGRNYTEGNTLLADPVYE